jgi:hypothetical protein
MSNINKEAIHRLKAVVEEFDALLVDIGAANPKYTVHAESHGQGFGFGYKDEITKHAFDQLYNSGQLVPLLEKGKEIVDSYDDLNFVVERDEFYPKANT